MKEGGLEDLFGPHFLLTKPRIRRIIDYARNGDVEKVESYARQIYRSSEKGLKNSWRVAKKPLEWRRMYRAYAQINHDFKPDQRNNYLSLLKRVARRARSNP